MTNEFNPDWDAMAVMVEEQQRMAAEIETLKRSLFQAQTPLEQEPVGWMYDWTTSAGQFIKDWTTSEAETLRYTAPNIISNVRPLYTAPPKREWQGLTENTLQLLWLNLKEEGLRRVIPFARAVEAKLKEKNHD